MDRAGEWLSRGDHFVWPTTSDAVTPLRIFHVELGDPEAPVLLLVHGWPTSSIDWFEVATELSASFRVCALDFPGHGFSDKPPGWGYSLVRDEVLLEFYLSIVLRAEAAVIVAHDRGDSVALLHAARCAEGRSATRLEHLVLTNGNIFLPLSNLTEAQRRILDQRSGPEIAAAISAAQLAEGMGATTFTPPRRPGDPEVEALTATFAHGDGTKVLHETIQYLVERSENERAWLSELGRAPHPVTLLWGLCDSVSPPRVAAHVWHEHLMTKPGENRLYLVPDADHYLQNDRPSAFVDVIRHALQSAPDDGPGPIGAQPGAPVLVDRSRAELPSAAALLRVDG